MALKKTLKNGAGRKQTKIVINQASSGPASASGEVKPVFYPLCSRWAEMAVSGGREIMAAMQVVPELIGIMKVPYDSKTATITARDQICIGSRVLSIAAVFNENEANEKIIIWTIEA